MDIIETIDDSVIQHGPHNDRIYLMRIDANTDIEWLIARLDELALKNGYGKIFAKIPAIQWPAFESAGYEQEAVVPGLFAGTITGLFVSKYFSLQRQTVQDVKLPFKPAGHNCETSADFQRPCNRAYRKVHTCQAADAEALSTLYRSVFKTYPFPVHKPAFIRQMIKDKTIYFCVRAEGKLVAAAAAEIDRHYKHAEMTDFATAPDWRGSGLASQLLQHMERKVEALGIKTAFTIARATSTGMNIVFGKNGYRYAGLLKNNSQISGTIQSMTVWYKTI